MPKALDQDLRDRVIDAVLYEGMRRRGASERYGVSASTAVKWLQAVARDKRRHPVSTGGHRRSALSDVRDMILHLIADQPDLTLEEICTHLQEEQSISASPSMLHYFFKREGISFKKNRIR